MTLMSRLERLLASAPCAEPVYLEATDWLTEASGAEIEAIYRDYEAKFQARKAELAESLGAAVRELPADRPWFDSWYPEARSAAAWEYAGKIVCLAVEHHDHETPVGLTLRCHTLEEIDELTAE